MLYPEPTLRSQEESMAQEENSKEHHWLLPFTTGMDLPTIATVLRLAKIRGATLIAVSFIATLDGRGVRLERIQQSKDFLEAIHYKALRLSVPVECHEMFTSTPLASIATQVQDLECDSIVLASEGDQVFFLHTQEMRHLMLKPPAPLVVLRFPLQANSGRLRLATRLLSWVQQLGRFLQNEPREARLSASPNQEKERSAKALTETSPPVSLRRETANMIVDRPSKKEA
jgi:hypothetical protein